MRSLDSHMQPQLRATHCLKISASASHPECPASEGIPSELQSPWRLGSKADCSRLTLYSSASPHGGHCWGSQQAVLSGTGLLGSWFVFLSTFKALKALYRRFISTSRIYSSLAAKELELGKATVPRPHPQPRKSHSLNVGPWSSWDWECSSVEEHLSLSGILRVLGSIPDTAQKNRPPHMRASHSTVSVSWFNNLYPVPTSQGNSVSISESIHDKNQDRSNQKITFLKSWLQASAHLH